MKRENPLWGAPRIHAELVLLGFEISEPTVSRYLRHLKRIPEESKASQWLAFLNNHREVIAAFDFFTVPTLCFRTLYGSVAKCGSRAGKVGGVRKNRSPVFRGRLSRMR